jgi:hypothetical protein
MLVLGCLLHEHGTMLQGIEADGPTGSAVVDRPLYMHPPQVCSIKPGGTQDGIVKLSIREVSSVQVRVQ